MTSRGTEWSVRFQSPSTAVFVGPSDSAWGANTTNDIEFHFTRLNSRTILPLTYLGSWTTLTVSAGIGCVNNAYCCTDGNDVRRWFQVVEKSGAKRYQVFSTSNPAIHWDFNINVTLSNQSSTIPLSDSNMEGVWPPSELIDPAMRGKVIPLSSSSVSSILLGNIAVDSTWARMPFVVPRSLFREQFPSFSLTQELFNFYMSGSCDLLTAQQLVRVSSTDLTDSFSDFWSSSVSSLFSQSQLSIPNSRLDPTQPPHHLHYYTSDQVTMLVDLVLDSEEYQLTPIHAEPVGTGGGGYIQYEEKKFHAFIDVTNAGRTSGYVEVSALRCCYAPTGAHNPTLSCANLFSRTGISGDRTGSFMAPAETLRFRFESSVMPTDQSGYCSFVLKSTNNHTRSYDIGFPIDGVGPPKSTPSFSCDPPYIPLPDPPFCQSPCTVDQIYNDVMTSCDPVDCVRKYKGGRNVYDPETGLCKPSIVPPPQAPSPPFVVPITVTPVNGTPTFTQEPDGSFTIHCGDHGTFDSQRMTCNCDPGWITDMQQPITKFEYCGVQSNFEPDTIYNQQQPPSKSQVNYLKLILAVSITFVLVLIVALVTAYFCSASKKKADKSDSSTSGEESSSVDE
jgi:hypothetical protein